MKKINYKLSFRLCICLSCILFICTIIGIVNNKKPNVSINDFKYIPIRLNGNIEFSNKTKAHYLRFPAQNYPAFVFQMDYLLFDDNLGENMVDSFHDKDTIWLAINLKDYYTKIHSVQPLSWSDKLINHKFITIYGVKKHSNILVDLNDSITKINNGDNLPVIVFLILWNIFFLILSLYYYRRMIIPK